MRNIEPIKYHPELLNWKPGTIINIDTQEEWDAFNIPHIHIFDSQYGGIVFGSSIWWVIDKNNRVIQHTRIKGLLCSCGAVLIFDED